jgi:hypothetical protein
MNPGALNPVTRVTTPHIASASVDAINQRAQYVPQWACHDISH